jgi:hypothetical protein
MKRSYSSAGIAVACLFSVLGLMMAQDQPAAPAQTKQMMKGKATKQGMMKKGAAPAGQPEEKSMMAQHEEVAKLVTQVAADLAALQNEPDIGIIKSKLVVDQAAIEKVRDQMRAQQAKMKTMMGGTMPQTEATPNATTPAAPPAVDHSQHH